MDTHRKLGKVAANLDDMSDTIEEIKDAAAKELTERRSLDDLQARRGGSLGGDRRSR